MIYTTFGIKATADRYYTATTRDELLHILSLQPVHDNPLFILGGGSNVIFTQHYPGTILHLENKGISLMHETAQGHVIVEAAAGENWDTFVQYCISHGWHGAENLAAIPGTVGASPVQNVGAYGCEAKDIIHTVRTIEIATGRERLFTRDECQFGYRNSIFKNELKGQYIVWSVIFSLSTTFIPNLNYKAITDVLERNGVKNPTPQQLADTVADIRWAKLPRPEETGSAGSFFKNPVVDTSKYQQLKSRYPDLVAYPTNKGYKLAAGWLIEQAGWKGRSLGRCGVYGKQALVLVNLGGCTGQEVTNLADAITADVRHQFGVTLEKEAIII